MDAGMYTNPQENENVLTFDLLAPLALQKRELHQLRGKLKNIVDKREIVFRERRLLTDRVDSIVKNIGEEIEARKKVSGG